MQAFFMMLIDSTYEIGSELGELLAHNTVPQFSLGFDLEALLFTP